MQLETQFDKFLVTISLTATQKQRIESAVQSLRNYLAAFFELDESGVFVQGSYATNSAIKPAPTNDDGEYDVDLMVVCGNVNDEPQEVKTKVVEALEFHGTYKEKIEYTPPSKPCVRLRYADDNTGKFHVDLVPARTSSSFGIPLEVPRSDEWKGTAPAEFAEWSKNQGENFRRTVMMLKRWRDEQQETKRGVKSIIFQVLIAKHLSASKDDATRITQTLESMSQAYADLETPPKVVNPVLPSENLSEKWTNVDFKDFTSSLKDAAELAREALKETDEALSTEKWQALLGGTFPNAPKKDLTVEQVKAGLADYSHRESLRWPLEETGTLTLNVTFERRISTGYRSGYSQKVASRPLKGNHRSRTSVTKGTTLYFKPSTNVPKPYEVWWQVVNTGPEAIRANGLRGGLFQSNRTDSRGHREDTSYSGMHWTQCFIVKDGKCVAKSDFYIVPIE
jgi:hypothetical protein